MKVSVTQDHIMTGVRCSKQFCPIALAIMEQIPDAQITVDLIQSKINGAHYWHPPVATDFIVAFDNKKPVQPFEFEMEKF